MFITDTDKSGSRFASADNIPLSTLFIILQNSACGNFCILNFFFKKTLKIVKTARQIYTTNQTLKYRVFATVTFDDRYLMESYNFSYPDDFQKYLDELRSSINGHVNMDVNVTQETGIITLSTCIATSPNERWLVNATREQ